MTLTGFDIVLREELARLNGKRIALVCNQASIAGDMRHILDLLLPYHHRGDFTIAAVFGPQHGLFGHTQDNMIEWEGSIDERTGLRVFSLYGEHREPLPSMLQGIDEIVIDLPDVGSRYYTFVWTMSLCIKAAEPLGIPLTVLDRPNPINGVQVEGTLLEREFESFVGQFPVPTRHGMTFGEIARHVQTTFFPSAQVQVVPMENWSREMYFEDTNQPWAMPSPNMPSVDTAIVYPGGCLLEATNLSEGRGTTRPFEIFGAPFLDSWNLAEALNSSGLKGCYFRPLPFQPTFNKHHGRVCGGCFLHVTDRREFEPVITYVAIMQEAIRHSGLHATSGLEQDDRFVAASAETSLPGFAWKLPPYEYVYDHRPIDILAGNSWLADAVESLQPLAQIRERFRSETREFSQAREAAKLYA